MVILHRVIPKDSLFWMVKHPMVFQHVSWVNPRLLPVWMLKSICSSKQYLFLTVESTCCHYFTLFLMVKHSLFIMSHFVWWWISHLNWVQSNCSCFNAHFLRVKLTCSWLFMPKFSYVHHFWCLTHQPKTMGAVAATLHPPKGPQFRRAFWSAWAWQLLQTRPTLPSWQLKAWLQFQPTDLGMFLDIS